ncbi:hypothetical protein SKAU_G00147610 [Synaphobranchus kaupii]|uniref:Uncharacterized protein n=1 Tax=Synaphobranchus kaupii TaxID=118154 RepID=A0A9Q1J510_SYNKA|nr:hypothetical protein SKAU_G00147610 [Synaphobranchus kaupii]
MFLLLGRHGLVVDGCPLGGLKGKGSEVSETRPKKKKRAVWSQLRRRLPPAALRSDTRPIERAASPLM